MSGLCVGASSGATTNSADLICTHGHVEALRTCACSLYTVSLKCLLLDRLIMRLSVQSPLSQAVPVLLLVGSLVVAHRTPGMAALSLRFTGVPSGNSAAHATQHLRQLPSSLLVFTMLSALLPEVFVQLRRCLIMRGFSMPDAAHWKGTAWQAVQLTERAAALARALNLVSTCTAQ